MQNTNQPNTDVINACKAFSTNHFKHFGTLPMEFEYDGIIYDFDTYTAFFTDIELDGIMGVTYGDYGLYPVPTKHFMSGESFRQWGFADAHFVPSYQQWRLYRAVAKALEQGLFYTSEIYAFVVREMSDLVNDELLELNSERMPVVHGRFGSEIYAMKDVVNNHAFFSGNREALITLKAKYGFGIGKEVKGPFERGGATYSSFVVTAIDEIRGMISVVAKKRGSRNKWTFTMGAGCERLASLFDNAA